MNENAIPNPTVERHCDVAIVGGSAAGLAAGIQLGRQRRSVIVVDAGDPRNAPAAHMHSYLGYDGKPPAALTSVGRDEVRRYGGEVLTGKVTAVTRNDDDRFLVELTGGHRIVARRVLAATGVRDVFPDIGGVAEQWGRGVVHCPFCHGYEVRDRTLVLLVTHPMSVMQAGLFRQLSDRLTLVLHDGVAANDPALEPLARSGVEIVDAAANRLVIDNDAVVGVELTNGETLPADAVVMGSRFEPRIEAFADLGLDVAEHSSGFGTHVVADEMGKTSVPGLYAAGNLIEPNTQVLGAAANGSNVGALISFDLAQDDLQRGTFESAVAADWDHRYDGDSMWSGNPNGSLVNEMSDVTPGTALDVGAGEGADAIWLAEQGWIVTANDVSQVALERAAAEAKSRQLELAWAVGDANSAGPFGEQRFDLVTAAYASIPRTGDDRGIGNLLDAVAPGGTLLIIGHDMEPMRQHQPDPDQGTRPFDPDTFVTAELIAAHLREHGGDEWRIEVDEKRPRPAGSASGHHHVDDIVLRARRSR